MRRQQMARCDYPRLGDFSLAVSTPAEKACFRVADQPNTMQQTVTSTDRAFHVHTAVPMRSPDAAHFHGAISHLPISRQLGVVQPR